jgi:transcriptional regulator with XRE-family HTH domain
MNVMAAINAEVLGNTSSGGTSVPGLRAALITAGLLWIPCQGTTSTYTIERPAVLTASNPDGADFVTVSAETSAQAILEIRRRSGLTWEELAELFHVSRRSVHHWASGKPIATEHEQTLRRTLAVLRQIDLGEAKLTRDFLLTPGHDGQLAIDLLSGGAFDEVVARGGGTSTQARPALTKLSPIEIRGRRPAQAEELVAALNDRPIVPTAGRLAHNFRVPKVT